MKQTDIHLAAGPLLFYWPKDQVFAFYKLASQLPLHTVYLGEVVCARRHELRVEDWLELADMLTEAGKTVVLSTQGLLETEADLNRIRKIASNQKFAVEANDFGAVQVLADQKVPFVAGMHLNVYNAATLRYLAQLGCIRWVPPVELGKNAVAAILKDAPETIETELFAYGKMPLAFSARCFTARHYGLNKDDCQFKCQCHPDGLLLSTQENQPFLSLNGIQTQSAKSLNLIDHIDEIAQMPVNMLRLSPQSTSFDEIVKAFDSALKGGPVSYDAACWNNDGHCNGYWLGNAGIDWEENT